MYSIHIKYSNNKAKNSKNYHDNYNDWLKEVNPYVCTNRVFQGMQTGVNDFKLLSIRQTNTQSDVIIVDIWYNWHEHLKRRKGIIDAKALGL